MSLTPVPALAELLQDPASVEALPPARARTLLLQLAPLTEALRLRALALPTDGNGAPALTPPEPDRLLSVAEAAGRLGFSKDHLYRHASRYPFTVRLGSRLRFSERGIERYIRARQGR